MAMSTSWVQKIAIFVIEPETVIERYADAGGAESLLPAVAKDCPAVPGPSG